MAQETWLARLSLCGGGHVALFAKETLTVARSRLVVDFSWCLRAKDAQGELQFVCLKESARNTGFACGVEFACVFAFFGDSGMSQK